MVDCGRDLNHSSTIAKSGSSLVEPKVYSWEFGMNRGITDTPILPDPPRVITNTVRGGGRGAIGLNLISTVSNRGCIVSVRSSNGVNRSSAVVSCSGTVEE